MRIKQITSKILTIELLKNISTKRGRMANGVILRHLARNKDSLELSNISLKKLSNGNLAVLFQNVKHLSSDPKNAILHVFTKENEHLVRSYRNSYTTNSKLFTKATGHYNKFRKEIGATIQEKYFHLHDNQYKKEENSLRQFINDKIFDTVVTMKDRISEFPQTVIGKGMKNITLQEDKFGHTFCTQFKFRNNKPPQ